MSASQKNQKEEAIVAKEKEAAELRQRYFGPEGEMAKKQEALITPIQDKIYEIVKQISIQRNYDAVIAIGCVIRGDTPHFDYICEGVTAGLSKLNVEYDTPVIFGLITTNNLLQAQERSGGRLGNKGDECAVTALQMVAQFK